jgi:hypothetical protein
MEYDVSEVRLEDVQTDVANQEVIELPTAALEQIAGGFIVLLE